MSQPVKLASTPPSEHRNGLLEILRELVDSPADERLALVVFDVRRVEKDVDAETDVPTVRFRRIELPLGLDRAAAWDMLQRATDARVGVERGEQPLPFTIHHADED